MRIELHDEIGDGVDLGIDGFYKSSLSVGGVSGGHDVSSITFYHLSKHSTWHLCLWLLIGLRLGHFATPFSQTPPYCCAYLQLFQFISKMVLQCVLLAHWIGICLLVFIINRFPYKVQFLLDDLSLVFKIYTKWSMVAHHHAMLIWRNSTMALNFFPS